MGENCRVEEMQADVRDAEGSQGTAGGETGEPAEARVDAEKSAGADEKEAAGAGEQENAGSDEQKPAEADAKKAPPKACPPQFKTSVGGQALMEGIMMRGPEKMCVAVRQPDGAIFLEETPVKKHAWAKIPLVRGVCSFIVSLASGYKCLMKSAEIALGDEAEEEETKFDKWINEKFGEKGTEFIMMLAAFAGVALAAVLFVAAPTAIAGLIDHFLPLGGWRAIVEGVFKLAILIGYMALVARLKEINRLFRYHGAEHKTITCYESGQELTVENVRPCSRFHPRCGTSFLLIVILLSILVGAVITTPNVWLRMALKFVSLPLVMGVSYEIIKLCGRYDNPVTHALSAPGLWLQRITTQEPDDSMIECAIAAVKPVLPANPEDGKW